MEKEQLTNEQLVRLSNLIKDHNEANPNELLKDIAKDMPEVKWKHESENTESSK